MSGYPSECPTCVRYRTDRRCANCSPEERQRLLANIGATLYVTPIDVFERFPRRLPLGNSGPDVEASHIIAEWQKGRSSTEIARLLSLPEQQVASVLRREILEHPELAHVGVQGSPKEENKKPETITRLKALKREIGEPEK